MNTRLLDRIGLLAITLYILGALSWWLPWASGNNLVVHVFGPRAHTALAEPRFFLLPPVAVGAAVYQFRRRRQESEFAPRRMAVAALGTGIATRAAWELYLFGQVRFNDMFPPTGPPKSDLGPMFLLMFPYVALCALLSILSALALPWLIGGALGIRPTPNSPRPPGPAQRR